MNETTIKPNIIPKISVIPTPNMNFSILGEKIKTLSKTTPDGGRSTGLHKINIILVMKNPSPSGVGLRCAPSN